MVCSPSEQRPLGQLGRKRTNVWEYPASLLRQNSERRDTFSPASTVKTRGPRETPSWTLRAGRGISTLSGSGIRDRRGATGTPCYGLELDRPMSDTIVPTWAGLHRRTCQSRSHTAGLLDDSKRRRKKLPGPRISTATTTSLRQAADCTAIRKGHSGTTRGRSKGSVTWRRFAMVP